MSELASYPLVRGITSPWRAIFGWATATLTKNLKCLGHHHSHGGSHHLASMSELAAGGTGTTTTTTNTSQTSQSCESAGGAGTVPEGDTSQPLGSPESTEDANSTSGGNAANNTTASANNNANNTNNTSSETNNSKNTKSKKDEEKPSMYPADWWWAERQVSVYKHVYIFVYILTLFTF